LIVTVLGQDGDGFRAGNVGSNSVWDLQVEVGNGLASPPLLLQAGFDLILEATLGHPVVVQELAHVVSDRVSKEHHDSLSWTVSLSDLLFSVALVSS